MAQRQHDYLPQIVIGIVVTVVGGLVLSFVQGWIRLPGASEPSVPSPDAETRLFLSRLSGPAGTVVLVSGQGFAGGETVTIRFHTDVCAETTADGSGAFAEVSCAVPEDWQFKMPVTVIGSGATSLRSATAQFRVT